MSNGQQPKSVTVEVTLEVTEDTPTFYVNYADVSHSVHDFGIAAARIPSKLSQVALDKSTETKKLRVEASVNLIVPPTLIPGLIEALKTQLALYESSRDAVAGSKGPSQ